MKTVCVVHYSFLIVSAKSSFRSDSRLCPRFDVAQLDTIERISTFWPLRAAVIDFCTTSAIKVKNNTGHDCMQSFKGFETAGTGSFWDVTGGSQKLLVSFIFASFGTGCVGKGRWAVCGRWYWLVEPDKAWLYDALTIHTRLGLYCYGVADQG